MSEPLTPAEIATMVQRSDLQSCACGSDVRALAAECERLGEQIEDLRQAASGNNERHDLLVAKHSGLPFDEARLDVLQAEVARAFPRIDAPMEAQMHIASLRAQLEAVTRERDEVKRSHGNDCSCDVCKPK